MDGGLADNIGLRALERQLVDPTGFVARRYNLGKASKVIFIVVDSKSGEPSTYNKSESAPGLADVAFKTATTSMDNFSAETIEFLRDRQRELDQARQDIELCKQVARTPSDCPSFAAPAEIHVVDVNLEAIADPARRAQLLSIGTNFSLPSTDVDLLIAAAGDLLDQNPDFQKLLAALRAPAAARPPRLASRHCGQKMDGDAGSPFNRAPWRSRATSRRSRSAICSPGWRSAARPGSSASRAG